MKKFNFILAVILLVLMAAGCSSNADNEKTAENQKGTTETQKGTTETQTDSKQQESQSDEEISNGSAKVITVLDNLKTNLETKAENSELIQTTGKELEESWDAIEKKVEENYPKDYENIEESLYPLISEAKKDKPKTAAIEKLMNETKGKMEAFKEKIES